jgi:hypothetical protein
MHKIIVKWSYLIFFNLILPRNAEADQALFARSKDNCHRQFVVYLFIEFIKENSCLIKRTKSDNYIELNKNINIPETEYLIVPFIDYYLIFNFFIQTPL